MSFAFEAPSFAASSILLPTACIPFPSIVAIFAPVAFAALAALAAATFASVAALAAANLACSSRDGAPVSVGGGAAWA